MSIDDEPIRDASLARALVAYLIVSVPSILIVHVVSAIMRHVAGTSAAPMAGELAFATALISLVSAITWSRPSRPHRAVVVTLSLTVVAAAGFAFLSSSRVAPAVALLLILPLASVIGWRVTRLLPPRIDGAARRAPIRSSLWLLLALVTVVQIGRLSTWVADPGSDWWLTTRDPFFAQHLCMTAYVYAADLNRQGVDNLYDGTLYPGLNPGVETRQTVDGLVPDDPYQYPPQFLLLPRMALALTNSFELIRAIWFTLQTLLFVAACWWLARSIAGRAGTLAAWLIPVVLISFPVLSNFQYGQFHLASVILGVVAVLLFQKQRTVLGGAALAFAIVAKLAPGILIVWLAARRRWRDIGWTAAFTAVYSALAFLVIGPEPFIAFFKFQLPQLINGKAFALADAWPEFRDVFIAINQTPSMLIDKLALLGMSGLPQIAAEVVHTGYLAAVLSLAVYAGLKLKNSSGQALVALALLNLAGLTSKGAWGDYISVGSVWLLTFVVLNMGASHLARWFLGGCWVFLFFSMGIMPMPGVTTVPTAIILSIMSSLLLIGLNVWYLLRRPLPLSQA